MAPLGVAHRPQGVTHVATPDPPPANAPESTEILARFANSDDADAPEGTVQLTGEPPVAFAGWLELMARIEELLASRRGRRVP